MSSNLPKDKKTYLLREQSVHKYLFKDSLNFERF